MAKDIQFSEIAFPPFIDRPLDAGWSMGLTAQHILLNQFRAVLGYRQPVIDNVEVEAVHQIRVNARRCRTALRTFKHVWDPATVNYFQKKLGRFADRFGVSRDLDVMVLYLEDKLTTASDARYEAFAWLLESNRRLRLTEQPKLVKCLRRFEQSKFADRFVGYFSVMPHDLWDLEERDARQGN